MSLGNFVVQKIKEYQGLPEGMYTAQLEDINMVIGNYGKYYTVNWRILRPSEYEGRIHQERFNIEHDNDIKQDYLIQEFSRFCTEIGELSEGDPIKEENFLFKIANILIKDKKSNGKVYKNIVKRELVSKNEPRETAQTILNDHAINGIAGSGMQPLSSTFPSHPLNDEVAF